MSIMRAKVRNFSAVFGTFCNRRQWQQPVPEGHPTPRSKAVGIVLPSIMSKVDDCASDAEAIEREELSRVTVSFSGMVGSEAIGLVIEDSADTFPLQPDQNKSW